MDTDGPEPDNPVPHKRLPARRAGKTNKIALGSDLYGRIHVAHPHPPVWSH